MEPADDSDAVVWALGQICILSAGPSGAVDRCARAIACSAMHPCRVMQSLRAPGGVPVLRIMLQVQMVTPHLVHVLSQSPGTVPMRQRGDRYVWSIFLRESAKEDQFQPNVHPPFAPACSVRWLVCMNCAREVA